MKDQEIDIRKQLNHMKMEVQREIDVRIAKVGLDLEVICLDNESGDWSRGWEHRIQGHYGVDVFYKSRIPKPKDYDELESDLKSDDSERVPHEVARVNMKHFVKHKTDFIETSLRKKMKDIEMLYDYRIKNLDEALASKTGGLTAQVE